MNGQHPGKKEWLPGIAVQPRKAAALIIIKDCSPPAVLLARRNENLAFMAGQYCFPGGRILDEEDISHVVHAPDPEIARALHAAVRETFEETGLLCVEGIVPPLEVLRAARQATVVSAVAFDQLLHEFGLLIDMKAFEPAGVWITPPISPIRFHTRYFLHHYQQECAAEVFHGEITELAWFDPQDARRQWRQGLIETSTPVAFVLGKLANQPPDLIEALRRVPNTRDGLPGRFEFRWGVYIIPMKADTLPPATHTNCVVVGESELYVIDPGSPDRAEQQMLLDQLNHLQPEPGAVRAVLLTHSHRDHVGAAPFLRDKLQCPILAHPAIEPQISFALDGHLEDGQVLQAEGDPPWTLRCIHTPGHDPGHVCFLEESSRTLIAGDMVANPGSIFISPRIGGDMTAYMASLDRLLALEFERIIPAHGIPLQSHAKELVQEHVDHRLWREQKVQQAIKSGATTINDLLHRAYDDVPPESLKFAEENLRAHLARLGAQVPS